MSRLDLLPKLLGVARIGFGTRVGNPGLLQSDCLPSQTSDVTRKAVPLSAKADNRTSTALVFRPGTYARGLLSRAYFVLPVIGLTLLAAGIRAETALPIVTRTLSLHDAVALAMTSSLTIKQVQADAASASSAARSTEAQEKPSVSATLYAATGDSSNILNTSPGVAPQNFFSVPPRGFADQNLMVMIPLFTGGTIAGRIASAQSLGAAAQSGVAGTRLSVTSEVTRAYANAVLGNALVAVTRSEQAAEDEQVRVTAEKVQAGRLAPVDLLREQAAQAEARQSVLAAVNAQAQALVALRAVLGLSQLSQITLSDDLDGLTAAVPGLPASLPDALHEADARRPEISAAAAQVQAAQAQVRGAEGAYAPQVYGVAMGDASAGQSLSRAGYTLALTASLPLYDGGQRRADINGAKARVERAQADALKVQQQVEQETASAWLTLQTATAQVQAAGVGAAAAQQGYDLASLRYNAGKSTAAERLDALAALVRAQGAVAQAKADVAAARAQLQAALGRA